MSKDLLNKIRGAIDKNEAPEPVKPAENKEVVMPVLSAETSKTVEKNTTPTKGQPLSKKKLAKEPGLKSGITGFEHLQAVLKAEKEGFSFNRRLVYIDDNIGEALDLLRKRAKINSNVLASYLLKQFLLENKDLIKALKEEKKGNMFFE